MNIPGCTVWISSPFTANAALREVNFFVWYDLMNECFTENVNIAHQSPLAYNNIFLMVYSFKMYT